MSGENRKRIETAIETLDGALGALRDLLAATDPQKDDAKARALAVFAEYQRIQAGLNGALSL